jgi:predicted transcriptional regulator YdeE
MRIFLAILVLCSFSAILFASQSAPPKIVHQPEFYIVGITARTTNAKEAGPDGIIGKQWQKFFQEGVLQQIPNKFDSNIYNVYSDYASDRNGEYSFTIGARVADRSQQLPPGLVLKTVPAGDYAVITTEKGPVANVIIAAWKHVLDMEDQKQLGGTRAYKSDFEFYDQRAMDPQNAQADLNIGLK